MSAKDTVLTALTEVLIENGIDLPFPTQQILFHDQTEESDGDRTCQREGWPASKVGHDPKPRRIVDALQQLAFTSHNGDQKPKQVDG